MARAVAILAAALALVAVAWSPPLDDFWLTLASGRGILDGADPGRALPFTHTAMQAGAINPQWGAQVVLAAPGSLEIALALNAALVFAGLLVTWVRGLARASLVASTVAMLLALAVMGPHLVPRAQSFSILLLPIALLLLERAGRRWWLPPAYGLLVVVWANLHGAFILAPLVAGLWLLGRLLSGAKRQEVPLLATVVLAAVAPVVNPAGATLYAYALGQAGNPAVRALATEWQPSWPWTGLGAAFWLFVVAVLVARPWRLWPQRAPELLVLAALLVLGATAVRSIPWFVLAATPLLAEKLDAALQRWVLLRRALGPIRLPSAIALDLAASVALVGILFQFVRPSLPAPLARLTPTMPVALVDALEPNLPARHAREPLFNSQAWGGYIAYRLGDRAATYLDGRIETPTSETWNRYLSIANGLPDAGSLLAQDDVLWALVEDWQGQLRQRLLGEGWEEVAASEVGWLLQRPDGRADRVGPGVYCRVFPAECTAARDGQGRAAKTRFSAATHSWVKEDPAPSDRMARRSQCGRAARPWCSTIGDRTLGTHRSPPYL